MRERLREAFEIAGLVVEALGVLAVLAAAAVALSGYLVALGSRRPGVDPYPIFRRRLGRGILVGLELMIAGDIIRTVVVAPSLPALAALAIVVLLRILLAWTLFLETEGRWPWQREVLSPPEARTERRDPPR